MSNATNTEAKSSNAADTIKRWHNLPSGKEIVTSINDGLAAAKKGDFAQARLAVGFYHAFREESGNVGSVTTYLVSLHDATQYMKGAGPNSTEQQRDAAKKFAADTVDMYASLFSADYNKALKDIEAIDNLGRKPKDSEIEEKEAAKKTVKRIRVMIGRALGVAAYIANAEKAPTHVKVQPNGEIRQVWEDDALNASFDSIEKAMREDFPKARSANEREEEKAEEKEDGGTTLLGSIEFITKHVTVQNYNAQSKEVRQQMEAMFKQLLPIFATKMTPEPVAASKKTA